ncbi:MAG: phosphoadenosine phosphosulfate reductase family protein, partial [Pseudoalteromonas tetraodonis]|nr:phosphoadenosine phosphosulfate reductase family protein [Pseudoalteromonas tetraodonis]
MSEFKNILQLDKQSQQAMLADANGLLANMNAEQRVAWALEHLPDTAFLSSSFGIQAAVMLHLMTSQRPDIPVVLTDTGYLFPETYQFIDQMSERLSLNLKVYKAQLSPAWQEAKFGKLWELGEEGI